MTQEELGAKLKALGINTKNYYPKKSFLRNGEPCVGLFERELKEDFYFHNNFDDKIYQLSATSPTDLEEEEHEGRTKYIVPLSRCSELQAAEEYVTLEDEQYGNMTLRDYACIHLKVPETDKTWLNTLIKKSREWSRPVHDTGPM